jgi:hypothetical protein
VQRGGETLNGMRACCSTTPKLPEYYRDAFYEDRLGTAHHDTEHSRGREPPKHRASAMRVVLVPPASGALRWREFWRAEVFADHPGKGKAKA